MKVVWLSALVSAACAEIAIDWYTGTPTNTTPTYQTSINPKYRMDGLPGSSNISKVVFQNMKNLGADHMRHVPWFPYPQLAVAELYEPVKNGTVCKTSWNFTYVDPITNALVEATAGHPIVVNFATTPEWMWQAGVPVPPVNQRDVPYEQGRTLRDTTFGEIVGYYTRLAEYYTKGGMHDECGVWHAGYNYTFAWWEVFNEPTMEHGLSPEYYDSLYDAIVTALQKVMPETKFVGLALGSHYQYQYYTHHLNRSNHVPATVPLDGISYHQYVLGSSDDLDELAQQYFPQMNTFIEEVTKIEGMKKAMSPTTRTFIDEIGCGSSSIYVDGFYMVCAATFAHLFAKTSVLQVEHLGVSQMIGFTGQSLCSNCSDEWPSTTMVDWFTGNGNARYWSLKVLIDEFPTGEKLAHPTEVVGTLPNVTAQAFTVEGKKKLLLVSTSNAESLVAVPAANYTATYVDQTTGNQFGCVTGCTATVANTSGTTPFALRPFGIAVLTLYV